MHACFSFPDIFSMVRTKIMPSSRCRKFLTPARLAPERREDREAAESCHQRKRAEASAAILLINDGTHNQERGALPLGGGVPSAWPSSMATEFLRAAATETARGNQSLVQRSFSWGHAMRRFSAKTGAYLQWRRRERRRRPPSGHTHAESRSPSPSRRGRYRCSSFRT